MFFDFRQNNSGGSFDYDKKAGISTAVVVEADDAEHANYRAERIGLYFDGCESGADCSCCGDRWSEQWGSYNKGDEVPSVYGQPVADYVPIIKWQGAKKFEVFVHYADGRIVGHHR